MRTDWLELTTTLEKLKFGAELMDTDPRRLLYHLANKALDELKKLGAEPDPSAATKATSTREVSYQDGDLVLYNLQPHEIFEAKTPQGFMLVRGFTNVQQFEWQVDTFPATVMRLELTEYINAEMQALFKRFNGLNKSGIKAHVITIWRQIMREVKNPDAHKSEFANFINAINLAVEEAKSQQVYGVSLFDAEPLAEA